MMASTRKRSSNTQTHKVPRQGKAYTSTEVKRKPGQKYYPNSKQAKQNRSLTGKAAATARRKRGTQWKHGRKSKADVRRGR